VGATTQITVTPALDYTVADNAVIRTFDPGMVNLAAGYVSGWLKEIAVDDFTVMPKVGQMVSFVAGGATYSVIQATATAILLDRPLETALVDNQRVFIGPVGQFNLGYVREAIALVVRPLAAPMTGAGAKSAVINYNNLSLRFVLAYDPIKQGHIATLDMLFGIKVLNTALGAVMLG
jgi:hypothetical protein